MPDNKFDQLFRDSLMDVEITPSKDLWPHIAHKLQPKKAKRVFPLMWMAAASVVVIVSAVLFTHRDDKIYLQGRMAATLVKTSHIIPQKQVSVNDDNMETFTAVVVEKNVAPKVKTSQQIKEVVPESSSVEKNIYLAVQPSSEIDHLPIKKATPMPLALTQEESVENQNVVYIASNPQNTSEVEEVENNRKGIRSVGDIINYVVDKVDKRENKILKFDTDDDDNTSLVSLNIGFLKFNKKNK